MEVVVIFARDIGVHDLVFEGDSLQVYNALQGLSIPPPAVANVIDGILSNVQFFCTIVFSHIKTDGNKPTHILVHHAKVVINFEAWVEKTPISLKML